MQLGQAHRLSGRLDLALQSFETAALLQPQNIDAKYYGGLVMVAMNRCQEAIRAFEGVLELDMDNSFARYAINLTQARLNATPG